MRGYTRKIAHARALRRQAAVRRSATSSTTATRASTRRPAKPIGDGRPADQLLPVRRRQQHPEGLRPHPVPRLPQPVHRRRAVEGAAPGRRDLLRLEAREGRRRLPPCHMPKVKDAKTGKFYTSHWQTNPKNYLKETCLQCHTQWNETQARYVIESMASHYQGKVRNAEFWLAQLDRQVRAGAAGRRARGCAQGGAREARRRARQLGMVDRGQRRVVPQPRIWRRSRSRNRSAASQDGIKILDDAIKAKQADRAAAPSAPRRRHPAAAQNSGRPMPLKARRVPRLLRRGSGSDNPTRAGLICRTCHRTRVDGLLFWPSPRR